MTDASGQRPSGDSLVPATALRRLASGGARDLALHDIATDPASGRTAQVTALIETGYSAPMGHPAGWATAMSIQDRQIALFGLALSRGTWPAWFTGDCTSCGARSDLRVRADEFPVTPAPGPIPAEIEIEGVRFRVPTGVEEAAFEADPEHSLVALCARGDVAGESEVWESRLDAALAAVLPGFNPELSFDCPECGGTCGWWFDPVDWIARETSRSLAEVDALARSYGWSEAEILALPEARRRRYLDLVGAGE